MEMDQDDEVAGEDEELWVVIGVALVAEAAGNSGDQ